MEVILGNSSPTSYLMGKETEDPEREKMPKVTQAIVNSIK